MLLVFQKGYTYNKYIGNFSGETYIYSKNQISILEFLGQ